MTGDRNPTAEARRGLDAQQLGHIARIDALSRQQPNDWSGMQGRGVSQDDFGGYRFQLAYAAYALALAHRHRVPNAPGLFAPAFRRLIEKILMPEVWLYWRDVSRGGSMWNVHLSDELHEEWDPVVRDNIMYSAYVQSMALLYDVLFDDHRYASPGALTFAHWSSFWGGEPKEFRYDQNSLNEHLYWQMVRSGFVGIACEPNCVFQICNQPTIFGFRMHDLLTGGTRAEEVVAGYHQAWRDFGRLGENGHYNMMITADEHALIPNASADPWVDAWCGTLMNAWNSDFVREHYPHQVADLLVPEDDGTLSVVLRPPFYVNGREAVNDTSDFGWVATWASEMGDGATLTGLLRHADRYMSPTWRDGALFYPRNDNRQDDDGRRTLVEPLTGNVLLGYARLNVADGWRQLYEQPWDDAHFSEPMVTEVADDVTVSRAFFDRRERRLHLRVARHTHRPGTGDLILSHVDTGCAVAIDGRDAGDRLRRTGTGFAFRCPDEGEHDVLFTLDHWAPHRGRAAW